MISQSDISRNFTNCKTLTDGAVTLSFFTPYTRRCCEVRVAGELIGTRYTPKTAFALYLQARKAAR